MVGVGNIVSVGGFGGTGGSGSSSGITDINGQIGPSITLVGTSGIIISPVAPNIINIGQSSSSVTKFAESFTNITSGIFSHNFGTRDVIVQIYDNSGPPVQIWPDRIIYDTLDAVSILFNTPQTGRVIII